MPRVVNDGFGTVRMCVADCGVANVYTCFSVGGTGMNGVIVRLFFNVGCIVDPRVVLIFCFSPGVFGWSFCPAALSLLRGFGAAWSTVLEARTCLLFVVVVRLRFLAPDRVLAYVLRRSVPGVCRRPGRGINTGLSQLAIFDLLSWFAGGCRRPGRGRNTGLSQLASL